MTDSSNDRGSKPPRTMFSLGRPGVRSPEPDQANASSPDERPAPDSAVLVDEEFSGYLCGACDAPLPVGAAFCGQCATPVMGIVPGPADEQCLDISEDGTVVDDGDIPDREQSPLTDLEVPDDVAGVSAQDGLVVEESAVESPLIGDRAVGDPAPVETEDELPQAVLYADSNQPEPLPAPPTGTWGISAPGYGSTEGDYVNHEPVEPPPDAPSPAPVAFGAYDVTPVADPYAAPALDPAAAFVTGAIAGTVADPVAAATPLAGTDGATTWPPAPPVPPLPSSTDVRPAAAPKKSRTGLIIGVAAAAALIIVIGLIVIVSSGGKKDPATPIAASQSPRTTSTAAAQTTTTLDVTTTAAPETTVAPETTLAPNTTAGPVTTPAPTTAAPNTTRPPVTLAPVAPGAIQPSVGNGGQESIPKNSSYQLILFNAGDEPASYALTVRSGNGSLSPSGSGSVAPKSSVVITINSGTGYEGTILVGGVLEGAQPNSYQMSLFVRTG